MITNVSTETRPSGAVVTTVEVTDSEGKHYAYEVACPVCQERGLFFDLLALLHKTDEATALADAHIHGETT